MSRDQGSGAGDQGSKKKRAASPVASSPIPDPRPPIPEQGGPKGPEPTRYGDWEIKGKCVDF